MPQGARQVKQNRAQYRESSRHCARITPFRRRQGEGRGAYEWPMNHPFEKEQVSLTEDAPGSYVE